METGKNQLKINKHFILTKVKSSDMEVKKLLNEGFEDPKNYLKINPNVIVGNNLIKN